jgi:predicted  nucleic acid-binding Zn-ribbon protein
MNPALTALIRLQQAENELRRVEAEVQAVPKSRAEVEARMAEERSRLDAARAQLEASQKARKADETAVQDLELKRSKYKSQLMEVKTNKEYTAMLHEIEAVEREIRTREDQILVEMERSEGLLAEVKREEVLYKTIEEKGRAEVKALEAKAGVLQGEAKRLSEERGRAQKDVPEEAAELFQRVARLRGAAVAPVVDGMCALCHVRLRPQMYVDVKKNEEIIQCPACARILYYEAPVPEVLPQP